MNDVDTSLKALMLRGLEDDAAAHARLLGELASYFRAYFGRSLGSHATDAEYLGLVELAKPAPDQRFPHRLGSSWKVCAIRIVVLATAVTSGWS